MELKQKLQAFALENPQYSVTNNRNTTMQAQYLNKGFLNSPEGYITRGLEGVTLGGENAIKFLQSWEPSERWIRLGVGSTVYKFLSIKYNCYMLYNPITDKTFKYVTYADAGQFVTEVTGTEEDPRWEK